MESIKYWENRYYIGGNSGSGSYNELQIFKIDIINSLIEEYNIKNIIDFGFGDGNQIKDLKINEYLGFDVSKTVLEKVKNRYKEDPSKKFLLYKGEKLENIQKSDMSMSLDVIYHILEDDLYENYLDNIFNSSNKLVVIYSNNISHKKNGHMIGRNFTKDIDKKYPKWKLIKKIDQKYPKKSSADFYIYVLPGM